MLHTKQDGPIRASLWSMCRIGAQLLSACDAERNDTADSNDV